jgi:hypothetical protein
MTPNREERIQKDREERIREERIRLRALEIWREQGRPDGRAREHWEQAEREVGGNPSGATQSRLLFFTTLVKQGRGFQIASTLETDPARPA